MLSLREFHNIGREHRYTPSLSFPVRAFTWLWGPIGLHPRIRAGYVIQTLARLNLPQDARILDAGCGRGLVLFWLATHYPAYQLQGIEIEADEVSRNRAVARALGVSSALAFEQGDLADVALGAAAYDLIFSVDVLEHIVDDERVLLKFHQALKPGGWLLLHLPLRHQEQRRIFPAFKHHLVEDHVRDEYLPAEIRAKLLASGFRIQDLHFGFDWRGELAFELNTLFWTIPPLRALSALLTYPVAWYLAYRSVNAVGAGDNVYSEPVGESGSPNAAHVRGNSMIILAQPER